jgi:RHS repeat-associated protein
MLDGAGGGLAAIVSGATFEWQLVGLHGDIIRTSSPDATLAPDGDLTVTDEYANSTDSSLYGYLGTRQRANDDLTALTYMGVRMYSPAMGRFLQTDAVLGGNESAYGYPADPVNRLDPDGRESSGGGLVPEGAACAAIGVKHCALAAAISWRVTDYVRTLDWLNPRQRNAARHYLWSLTLALAIGLHDAKIVGRAHESGPNDYWDSRVDMRNNRVAWIQSRTVNVGDRALFDLARSYLWYVAIPLRQLWCERIGRKWGGMHRCRW